jgi:hypothetical protein
MMNTIGVSYGLQRGGQVLDSFERSFEKSLKKFSQISQIIQKCLSLKGIKFTMISVRFNAPALYDGCIACMFTIQLLHVSPEVYDLSIAYLL